jgi:hypothetical protein
VASILVDTNSTLLNLNTSIVTQTSQILSTLDTPITNYLSDLNSGLDVAANKITSILTDTAQISNIGATATSAILSTIDGPITAYLSDLNSGLDVAANKITSILVDTATISNIGATATSAILSTIDGPISNSLSSILTDTGTTLPASITAVPTSMFAAVVEGAVTFKQWIRRLGAEAFGRSSGGGTTTVNFRDTANSKNRISATVDETNNRTAVTYDDTD